MAQEISRRSALVSPKGGTLNVVSPEGEVLMAFAVPAGRVRASQYLDLVPEGCMIEIASGVAVADPPHRVSIMAYGPGAFETAANPDFQPTKVSEMERAMQLRLRKMMAKSDMIERRMRSLEAIERIPSPSPAPAPEPPLVEAPAASQPAPEPEAKKADG